MERRKDSKGRVLEKGESQRKDGRYIFQYKDITGKRKCVYSNNLSDLRKLKKIILRDLDDGLNTEYSKKTLNEMFALYLKTKNLKNSTENHYISLWDNHVKDNALGHKKLCDIKKADVLLFYKGLKEKGMKYATINAFHGMLSPCFNFAVENDIIRKNPCSNCMKEFEVDSKARIALSVTEQKELLGFVQNSKEYSRYYPMLVFMIGTAVRCGEAIGLTWNDVDFKEREISINHQLVYKKLNGKCRFYASSPKTGAGNRTIPMSADVYKALLAQRELQLAKGRRTNVTIDGYSDFVFSTKSKNPITPSLVNSMLLNIVNRYNRMNNTSCAKKEQLPHISAHILRHTGCTRMAESGMDVKVLQYIMGHKNITTTMEVYNHISTERNIKEISKLEILEGIG